MNVIEIMIFFKYIIYGNNLFYLYTVYIGLKCPIHRGFGRKL